jgi:oligopeptide transport system ATP-binding protein
MVFQDPLASLNPKWSIFDIVEEPLICGGTGHRESRRRRVEEVLDLVGLPSSVFGRRHPVSLSGGQCQRVAIARAVVSRPALVVCDEATSSLDVLIQAQILELFQKLRKEFHLSLLFISHDLLLVKHISDRVVVLHAGQVCEIAPAAALFDHALHPYTQALLASAVIADRPQASALMTPEPPLRLNLAKGCRFRSRCPSARRRCADEEPSLMAVGPGHLVACHFPQPVVDAVAHELNRRL